MSVTRALGVFVSGKPWPWISTCRSRKNIKERGAWARSDGAPDLEFRLATEALKLEKSGLSYQRVPPGYRFPYGHTHKSRRRCTWSCAGAGG